MKPINQENPFRAIISVNDLDYLIGELLPSNVNIPQGSPVQDVVMATLQAANNVGYNLAKTEIRNVLTSFIVDGAQLKMRLKESMPKTQYDSLKYLENFLLQMMRGDNMTSDKHELLQTVLAEVKRQYVHLHSHSTLPPTEKA